MGCRFLRVWIDAMRNFQTIDVSVVFKLPAEGEYGCGLVFLPRNATLRRSLEAKFAQIIQSEGQVLLGWRTVPTDNSMLGDTAKMAEPFGLMVLAKIDQGRITSLSGTPKMCTLYLVGNPAIAKRIIEIDLRGSFYVPFRVAVHDDGSPDGGVHQLFTVAGRSDVFPAWQPGTCSAAVLPQPDFENEYRRGNVRFRIPLQLFGLGVIDGIQDREILARHQATAVIRAQLGIVGVPNRSGNDGTVTRFGWKAQNKSIAIFAGEAYNVEMGVTNDLFTQATDESPVCTADKSEPNDITRMDTDDTRNQSFLNPLHEVPDWLMFAMFMRFLDVPQPAPLSTSALHGQELFGTGPGNPGVGCAACHTTTMVTPPRSETAALQNLTVHPFTDLLIHHMGSGLADDITQGLATGDMFRTTPLWGLGQRRFFLHDGRTDDLLQAIDAHFSPAKPCGEGDADVRAACYGPSEANRVVARFKSLTATDQQSILDFLRSL